MISSLIAFNGMLTSHCGNLSTHHYHVTYHPCFNTANIIALMPCHLEKSDSDQAALLYMYQRNQEKENKEIVLTRIGLTSLPPATKGPIISSTSSQEGQDLEAAAMVSSTLMKLLPKTL